MATIVRIAYEWAYVIGWKFYDKRRSIPSITELSTKENYASSINLAYPLRRDLPWIQEANFEIILYVSQNLSHIKVIP